MAFVVIFAIFIALVVERNAGEFYVTFSFVLGAITSIVCGYVGMAISVRANVRTTKEANESLARAFVVAFRGGAVLGFVLVGLGLLNLQILILIYKNMYLDFRSGSKGRGYEDMFEAIAGYGLGASAVALFGRVGGGIYTKAADVGADLVGKVIEDLDEDSINNPGTIADNVGDNVGDIAGMGADLFGSLAESTCAALVISGSSEELISLGGYYYPLLITASGIVVCILTSFVATNLMKCDTTSKVMLSLNLQLLISTILMTPVLYACSQMFLPSAFTLSKAHLKVYNKECFYCTALGLWTGYIIGVTTNYYTSGSYAPVRRLANSCAQSAATNIIQGLALGFYSTAIPITCIALTIFFAFSLADMYGIALAALGMLSTMCIGLTIDGYGPIADNAGGIAEMCALEEARTNTDILDAAGNTTAAIGKGFAIGSACLVALALFGAFSTETEVVIVNILKPLEFSGLIFGAMIPYYFTAQTMGAVGDAANAMIIEIQRQFETLKIREGQDKPDYEKCIKISTDASIRQMIAPGLLVILSPLLFGFLLGPSAVSGLLAGAIVSGVQIAIAYSNTGGAWDNAKKYIEAGKLEVKGEVQEKKSEPHKNAVTGDTVGDPMKDTSGPSINILIKLMAITSLVFGQAFKDKGGLLLPYVKIK